MKDKSLGIWLIVLFGLSGLAVIVLAWLWPTLQSDRITATLLGGVGIAVAVIRALMFRQSPADKQAAIKVPVENKS
jgi:Flp pilus assembly protein TadB